MSIHESIYLCIRLSICLSSYLSIDLSTWQSIDLSINLSTCLPVRLSVTVCLSVRPSVCLFVSPSVCLSVDLSICLSVCLSVHLSICLPVYLPIYLSIYLQYLICQSALLSIYRLSINPSIHPSVHPSVRPSIHSSIHRSIDCPSIQVHLPIYRSIHLSMLTACLRCQAQRAVFSMCQAAMMHLRGLGLKGARCDCVDLCSLSFRCRGTDMSGEGPQIQVFRAQATGSKQRSGHCATATVGARRLQDEAGSHSTQLHLQPYYGLR